MIDAKHIKQAAKKFLNLERLSPYNMKILIVHCTYQFQGGEYTVVQEEMKLLKSIGNTVKLLQFSNQRYKFLKLLLLPFNIPSYIKTLKSLKDFKPDIVHVHNLHFGASASVIYAIKKMKIPIIITLHNYRLLCPSATLFYDGKPFLNSLREKFCWTAVKKGVYKNSSLLTFWLSLSMRMHERLNTWHLPTKYIVLSQHAKDLFQQSKLKLTEKQLIIKPNFSSPPAEINFTNNDHFLFIGRLSKEKGIELLLETFSKLKFLLKIAGDGSYKDEVIEYSKRFSNIEYIGVLNKDSINTELQSCSALIFPSIWYEGMPLTIIEAFACGTPVIASNLGAMQTMIIHGYNGLHFQPETENGLELQVKKWVTLSKADKATFSFNAFKTYSQNYTPEKNAEQLVAIYDSVIAKNS